MTNFKTVALSVFCAICALPAIAQTNVISNNKSLAFFNPAMQNYDMNKGLVSISYIPNLLSETSNYANYLALAEYKVNEMFRIGVHNSVVDSRLNKLNSTKFYTSYKFALEEGNYFIMGVEMGMIKDMTKLAEFNKVYAPTRTEFTDSIAQSFDLGFGAAYATDNFIIGVSVNRLNSPKIVPYPNQYWTLRTSPDTAFEKKDTLITLGESDFINSKFQSYINAIYSYDVNDKLEFSHSLSITNLDLDGVDFIGLQNFANFNDKFMIGLGIYDNGNTGFMASAGVSIGKNIKLEIASFIKEEFEFNPLADNPDFTVTDDNIKIDAKGAYESTGYVPSFEANLRIEF